MNYRNNIVVVGTVASESQFSHSSHGVVFCHFTVVVKRISGKEDTLPVITTQQSRLKIGDRVMLLGELRTPCYKRQSHATQIYSNNICITTATDDINQVNLIARIARKPTYRTTPSGTKMADIMLEVDRGTRVTSDYIPCIAWWNTARYAKNLRLDARVRVQGALQSREYLKKYEDGTEEIRTVYEVSVSRIDVVESEENEDESRSEENL